MSDCKPKHARPAPIPDWRDIDQGDMVVYYRGGDPNGDVSITAAVTKVREPGCLDLLAFAPGNPIGEVITLAYHHEHRAITENPKLAQKYGVWDVKESHHLRQIGKKEARKEAAARASEAKAKREESLRQQNLELQERVLELRAKNMSTNDIADALGEGFTPNRVQTILRRALERTGAA